MPWKDALQTDLSESFDFWLKSVEHMIFSWLFIMDICSEAATLLTRISWWVLSQGVIELLRHVHVLYVENIWTWVCMRFVWEACCVSRNPPATQARTTKSLATAEDGERPEPGHSFITEGGKRESERETADGGEGMLSISCLWEAWVSKVWLGYTLGGGNKTALALGNLFGYPQEMIRGLLREHGQSVLNTASFLFHIHVCCFLLPAVLPRCHLVLDLPLTSQTAIWGLCTACFFKSFQVIRGDSPRQSSALLNSSQSCWRELLSACRD